MNLKKISSFILKSWGVLLLSFILLTIIIVNFKPGYFVLGNDNFSPELNPSLTLQRSLSSPAWREYRALGIPSDSEQADIFRTFIFFLLSFALPKWLISQIYLFFTFFIASFSMGMLAYCMLPKKLKKYQQIVILIAGLIYTSNLLTSWLYFYPLHLFIAAYAFLPLILWRLVEFFKKNSAGNAFLLLLSSLLLSTSALTATMFIVCSIVIFIFLMLLVFQKSKKSKIKIIGASFIIIFTSQLFWALPFLTYVKSNYQALQSSNINKEITAISIENEKSINTPLNSLRYFAPWLEKKEDNLNYTYSYRNWYKSDLAIFLGLLPIVLALIGLFISFFYKKISYSLLFLTGLTGWFLIKGSNPPLGNIYTLLQENVPLFAQVFRWQSSKFWPLLIIPIPILASVGVAGLAKLLKNKVLVIILTILIGGGLLYYAHPYFKGGLIRKEVFVKVPNEYFNLAKYLKNNDVKSRIYLAPEANTLYFRNYSWGFWGSVVLNYIIPNPIIEKALVIGSFENAQSFEVIKNAYYSQDPDIFINTLKRYHTPYVLSDKNASTGNTGYAYDWSIHNKIIENNPKLELVWQEEKLALYKIKDQYLPNINQTYPVSSQHNWTRLNKILGQTNNQSYLTKDNYSGDIYPFGLAFESYDFTAEQIKAKLNYQGPNEDYLWTINNNQLLNSPINANYQKDKLTIKPAFPAIQINQEKHQPNLPEIQYEVKDNPNFISIDKYILDGRNNQITKNLNINFSKIKNQELIKQWSSEKQIISIINNSSHTFAKTSVVEAELKLTLNSSTLLNICFWSKQQKRCLNQNISAYLNKGLYEDKILIPELIRQDDTLTIYLNFKLQNEAQIAQIQDIKLNIFNESKSLEKQPSELKKTTAKQNLKLAINTNDQIELIIPQTQGPNTFIYQPSKGFFPEVNINPEDKTISANYVILKNNNLFIDIFKANASVFPNIYQVSGKNNLGLIIYSGKNIQAVPAKLSLRNKLHDYKLYQKYTSSNKSASFFDLTLLPQSNNDYILESFYTAFGIRPSKNQLSYLGFQLIPQSWYKIKLESSQAPIPANSIKSINQAISPYWIIKNKNAQNVRINGWEQGWLTENNNAKVYFWPNYLSWLAYLLIAGITLVIFLKALSSRRPVSKD